MLKVASKQKQKYKIILIKGNQFHEYQFSYTVTLINLHYDINYVNITIK